MSFDFGQTRRGYNEICKVWSKRPEDDEIYDNEIIYKRIPDVVFYAREVSPIMQNNNILASVAMVERNTVTVETPENIQGVKPNDYIMYQDEYWIVVDVQSRQVRQQQTEFMKHKRISHHWFLSLRK